MPGRNDPDYECNFSPRRQAHPPGRRNGPAAGANPAAPGPGGSYAALRERLGPANATGSYRDARVPAGWGFEDGEGRAGFVWAYRAAVSELPNFTCWSVSGDQQLLDTLFPGQIYWWY